ncbi:MAG: M56 family metallopeptidase [Acidobacteriota bacterium]
MLNWVCQGTVVAMATFALLRALERSRASTRHAFCWLALLVVLLLPWLPSLLASSYWRPATPVFQSFSAPNGTPAAVFSLEAAWWNSQTLVIAFCALWFAFFGVRVLRALGAVRAGRSGCRPFPPETESRLAFWKTVGVRGRRTRLVVSESVGSAAVLGCGSPIVAIAPTLVEHLTADELDRVVVHEWAHVQRRDDVLNLLQLAVRAVAGWHPAVWWLNRQLVIEREMACDEMVVSLTGSPKAYASSLAKVASLSPVRWARLASIGALSSSALTRRVARIVGWGNSLSTGSSTAAAFAALLLLMIVALGLSGLRLVGIAPRVATSELDSGTESVSSPRALAVRVTFPSILSARLGTEPVIPIRSATRPEPANPEAGEPQTTPAAESPSTPQVPAPLEEGPGRPPALASTPLAPTATAFGAVAPSRIPRELVSERSSDEQSVTPWSAAAGAGVAIGRGSQKAGVATATFFGRIGKKIGQSF